MSTNRSEFDYVPSYIKTANGYRHEIIPGAGMAELWHGQEGEKKTQYIMVEQPKDFWARGGPNGGSEITGNYDLYLANTKAPFKYYVGTWNRWRREITPPEAIMNDEEFKTWLNMDSEELEAWVAEEERRYDADADPRCVKEEKERKHVAAVAAAKHVATRRVTFPWPGAAGYNAVAQHRSRSRHGTLGQVQNGEIKWATITSPEEL